MWLGYYENAFRLVRETYGELDRPRTDPDCPIAGWRDAFRPASSIGLGELHDGEWLHWLARFNENQELPGEPDADRTPLTPAELVQRALRLLGDFGNSLFADPGSTGGPAAPSPLVLSTNPIPPRPSTHSPGSTRPRRAAHPRRGARRRARSDPRDEQRGLVAGTARRCRVRLLAELGRDRGDPPAQRARRARPRRRRDPPHVALPRPRARDRARHRRRRAHDPPRGLRGGRRRGLPRMADASRCGARDHRVAAGPGRVRPRVRLRARRRRAPAVRSRDRSAAVGEDVLRLPRCRLLEDDRGHGRRRLRAALRRAARPRRGVPVLPSRRPPRVERRRATDRCRRPGRAGNAGRRRRHLRAARRRRRAPVLARRAVPRPTGRYVGVPTRRLRVALVTAAGCGHGFAARGTRLRLGGARHPRRDAPRHLR